MRESMAVTTAMPDKLFKEIDDDDIEIETRPARSAGAGQPPNKRNALMNTVVIEHVALNELLADWRARLLIAPDTLVTVRIEEEAEPATHSALTDNPMFGMWRDREDMADVDAYMHKLRAPRYRPDGSRNDEEQ